MHRDQPMRITRYSQRDDHAAFAAYKHPNGFCLQQLYLAGEWSDLYDKRSQNGHVEQCFGLRFGHYIEFDDSHEHFKYTNDLRLQYLYLAGEWADVHDEWRPHGDHSEFGGM